VEGVAVKYFPSQSQSFLGIALADGEQSKVSLYANCFNIVLKYCLDYSPVLAFNLYRVIICTVLDYAGVPV